MKDGRNQKGYGQRGDERLPCEAQRGNIISAQHYYRPHKNENGQFAQRHVAQC